MEHTPEIQWLPLATGVQSSEVSCMHLHKNPLGREGGSVSIDKPLRSVVHSLVREGGDGSHPWTLVFERLLSLGPTDQLVGESGALHHVVVLVRLPGHGELDVALELPTSATQLALNLTTPMACPASEKQISL